MAQWVLFSCLLVFSLQTAVRAHTPPSIDKNFTEILENSKKNERPRPLSYLLEHNKTFKENYSNHSYVKSDTLIVEVNLFIYSISSVSVIDMDYSIDVLLRQRWMDPRLINNSTESIPLNYLKDKLWTPDLFFRNAKSGVAHTITVPNQFLWVNSQGVVTFSQKISLKLSCNMNLGSFPMDTQNCLIDIGSYGYSKKNMDLKWWEKKQYDVLGNSNGPENSLQLPENMTINEFDHPELAHCECRKEFNSTGDFGCLIGAITLKRKFGFYLTYAYLPSLLVVVISWLSFFIDHTAVPARISIGLLCVLALMTQMAANLNSLPRVSYIKAIDLWMFSCLALVVLSFLEFAFVNSINRKMSKVMNKFKAEEIYTLRNLQVDMKQYIKEFFEKNREESDFQLNEEMEVKKRLLGKKNSKCESIQDATIRETKVSNWTSKIDSVFALLFPLLVIILNLVYWIYFLKFAPVVSEIPDRNDIHNCKIDK